MEYFGFIDVNRTVYNKHSKFNHSTIWISLSKFKRDRQTDNQTWKYIALGPPKRTNFYTIILNVYYRLTLNICNYHQQNLKTNFQIGIINIFKGIGFDWKSLCTYFWPLAYIPKRFNVLISCCSIYSIFVWNENRLEIDLSSVFLKFLCKLWREWALLYKATKMIWCLKYL